MRYKQKRKSRSSIVANSSIKERINGKTDTESDENPENEGANEIKVEDLNDNSNDNLNDNSNDVKVEDKDVKTNDSNDDQNEVKSEVESEDKIEIKSPKKAKKDRNSKNESFEKELVTNIAENDIYFSTLIDLIPPKIYFEGNEEILESMAKQKRDLFDDDLDLSKKNKQKRFKLDPNSSTKISEIANNFYGTNKKSNKNQSVDNKMEELKKKLNEKITRLKSIRGQQLKRKNKRESKKQKRKENSMRAHKQKGFAKRQFLEPNEGTADQSEPKPKKVKSVDKTDVTDGPKMPNNLPKIYNKEGNIVYSKFDLVSSTVPTLAQKKINSKKHNLKKLLVKTKRDEKKLSELAETDAPKAQYVKEKKLWKKAIDLSEGIKVKDNSKLLQKSIKKKRKSKEKSKKIWGERKESLQKTMDSKKEKREKNINERKQKKKEKKIKGLKKRGRLVSNK